MVRVLITGASGTLGKRLVRTDPFSKHELFYPSSNELDVRNDDAIQTTLRRIRPEVVVHCAARIRTRGADTADERREMSQVNVLGTGALARAAAEIAARFVYVSTDFVFDGSKAGGLYTEQDPPCPLGYYPLTKYAGEASVGAHPDALIVRLSFNETWPYPKAFTDRFTSKLPAQQAAHELAKAALTELRGVLHIGGPRLSYFEFARSLGADVQPTTLEEFQSADPLPVDTSLNSARWQQR